MKLEKWGCFGIRLHKTAAGLGSPDFESGFQPYVVSRGEKYPLRIVER